MDIERDLRFKIASAVGQGAMSLVHGLAPYLSVELAPEGTHYTAQCSVPIPAGGMPARLRRTTAAAGFVAMLAELHAGTEFLTVASVLDAIEACDGLGDPELVGLVEADIALAIEVVTGHWPRILGEIDFMAPRIQHGAHARNLN